MVIVMGGQRIEELHHVQDVRPHNINNLKKGFKYEKVCSRNRRKNHL